MLKLCVGLATGVQVAAFRQCDHFFNDRAQFFCFWQSCFDLLMFDERASHVREERLTVLVCAVQAAVTSCVTHVIVSILF